MTIRAFGGVCLSVALGAAFSCAQAQSPEMSGKVQATTTAPAAYVYVSSNPANSSTNEIVAYRAGANGSLTAVPGSPFREDVGQMAANGKYVMAVARSTTNIDAFLIQQDGALTYAASTNYAPYNGANGDCGSANQVFFDHTGASLYVQEFDATSACANTVYAAFNVVKSTGKLAYLDTVDEGAFPGADAAAYFIGNDVYAYEAADSACMYYIVNGVKRASNGTLTGFNAKYNLPTPPSGARGYILNGGAADPTNHVAFWMQPANPPGCSALPVQLASYTVDASGNLSTTNTAATMPVSSVAAIYDMKMAPSGKLLAIGGQQGLQIFHFNGAAAPTHYTGLITKDPIQQMFWDTSNHLYAISPTANKLYVFTVTPTGYTQAPGSPYSVSKPFGIIVQPPPIY